MAEKVTTMVIKVDLRCPRCYKKIKKVLCKFPQIRDQVFDEKQNTVTITVVCCSPEKIKQKICCKGGDTIKAIEIKVPDKPKAPEPEKKKEPEKPKAPEPEKPKAQEPEKKKEQEKPKAPAPEKKETEKPKDLVPEKKKEPEKPKAPELEKPKEKQKEVPVADPPKPPPAKTPEPVPVPAPAPAPAPVPVPGCPPGNQIGVCCMPCYEGHAGGPCYHGYGPYDGPPPSSCYEGYGRPVYDSWGGGGWSRGYYGSRCGCGCEENPSVCAFM